MIKASIVLPIYNTAQFLPEALDSVMHQSEKDIEIICVNDGSPDNSLDILEQYAKKDTRITIINQENQGVSVARNSGLAGAHGEYVFFMDSDDTIDENFIKTSYDVAKANNSDLVVVGKNNRLQFIEKLGALPVMCFMVKKDFLTQYPEICFPPKLQPCEDGLFTHKLLALTDKISRNDRGVYNYREHDNQNHHQINTQCEKVLRDIPKWFDILTEFYDKYDLWQKQAKHLLYFIEVEPFKLRFIDMPFNKQQKEELFDLIHHFFKQNIKKYITKKDYSSYSKIFVIFITADSFKNYEKNIKIYKVHKAVLRFLSKFVPVRKYRKELRRKYL